MCYIYSQWTREQNTFNGKTDNGGQVTDTLNTEQQHPGIVTRESLSLVGVSFSGVYLEN